MLKLSSITNFLSSALFFRAEGHRFVISHEGCVQENFPLLSEKEILQENFSFGLNFEKNCKMSKNSLANLTKGTMMPDQPQWSLVVADHCICHDTNIGLPFQAWHNSSHIGSVQNVDILNNINNVAITNRNNAPKKQVIHCQKSHQNHNDSLVADMYLP